MPKPIGDGVHLKTPQSDTLRFWCVIENEAFYVSTM
jgi:hypothetical protein